MTRRKTRLSNEAYAAPASGCCAACGEPCEEKSISLALPRSATGLAVIRNVPAEVCPICGETRFSLRTTGRLMALFRGTDPPDDVAVVPIYDLNRSK
jgi:YgiT-type zinc finger domain-containing protein